MRRRDGELITSYVCGGRGRLFGDPLCQTLIGTDIDASVSNLLLEVVTPMALELALAVQQEIAARIEEADRLRYRRVERARYEAERARHRYLQVDAANRLVADSLESDWNAKLAAFSEAQHDYERQRATDPEVREQIDTLLDEYTDAQVAHILNGRGAHTGAGLTFDADSIRWVRCSAKLKSLRDRLIETGMLTGKQVCAKLGVSRTSLGRLRAQGHIEARICNDKGEWLYRLPEAAPSHGTRLNEPLVTPAAGGAV